MINFKEYKLLKESNNVNRDALDEILSNLVNNNYAWLKDKGISVGDKGNYWILMYDPQSDPNVYNKITRGLVVAKPTKDTESNNLHSLIKSFPFTRFFNQGEGHADAVDLNDAEMNEKLDGTFVCVFFPAGNANDPHWHTKRMLSSNAEDMSLKITSFHGKTFVFFEVIKQYLKELNFSDVDLTTTYIFEFIHEASHVVTKYQDHQYGLYLIGARHLGSFQELSENELDKIANKIGSKRARRWNFKADHQEIIKMLDEIEKEIPDFEGAIFRDNKTGNRIKLKRKDYLLKHRMIDQLSYKNIIPLYMSGETDEILAYFPHAIKIIESFEKSYNNYVEKVVDRWTYWKNTGLEGRELVTKLLGSPFKRWDKEVNGPSDAIKPQENDGYSANLVLKGIKLDDKEKFREFVDSNVKELVLGHNDLTKKLMKILNLNDEENNKDDEN